MEIVIKRRITFYVWKIIPPICLIVMMSWAPFWIPPRQIGANVATATTSFLTLVAYLFAISVLLPRVSYFTRLDLFILMSTLMVFLSLVQTVVTARMVDRSDSLAIVMRIHLVSRIIHPLLLLAVLAIAFIL